MGDRTRGVYHKFNVTRTDGKSEPGQKHDGCFYFVLDCDHDPHARAALQAYAESCKDEYPALSSEVSLIASEMPFGSDADVHITDLLRISPTQETGVRCSCRDFPGSDEFCTAHKAAETSVARITALPISAEDEAIVDALIAQVALRVPKGHFWRGEPESNRHVCRNCGEHYDKHLHTDEASLCPTANR